MYDGTVIPSAEGVRQGDPLGPFFFSLAIRQTLELLQEKLKVLTPRNTPPPIVIAYLDDIYILSGQELLPSTLSVLLEDAPIKLNEGKTKAYTLQEIRQNGLKVLGSFIGPTSTRKQFLQGKTDELKQVLLRLRQLPKQHALLLLRASTSTLLRYLPRTLDP